MSEPTDFVIDLDSLDHTNRNERILERLLNVRTLSVPSLEVQMEGEIEEHVNARRVRKLDEFNESARKLIELYLAAVRRRNGLRRNWHPEESYRCDEAVLNLICRQELKGKLGKRIQECGTKQSDGGVIFSESQIEELTEKILGDVYSRKGKRKQLSPL
jgi:hypothetical protein